MHTDQVEDKSTENTSPDESVSMEDLVREAYDTLEKESAPESDSQAKGEKEEWRSADEEKNIKDRARDERGRFAKSSESIADPAKSADTATQTDLEAAPEQEIELPQGWTAEGKEWLRTQPKEAIAEHTRIDKEMRSYFTRGAQEVAAKREEYERGLAENRAMLEAIRPHLTEWGINGLTPAEAISQLGAFQTVCKQDPVRAVMTLAHNLGVDLGKVATGEVRPGTQTQQRDPALEALASEVQYLRQWREEQEQQRLGSVASEIDREFSAMQNAVEEGKYVYPDLHNPQFVQTLEHLAAQINRTTPGLGWRDLLERAYLAAGGRRNSSSWSPSNGQAPRLDKQKHLEQAKRASSSVSGSRASPTYVDAEDIPDDIPGTVELAWKQLGL